MAAIADLQAECARLAGELEASKRQCAFDARTAEALDHKLSAINHGSPNNIHCACARLRGLDLDARIAAENELEQAKTALADLRQFHDDHAAHTAASHRVMVEEVDELRAALAAIAEQATQQIDTPLAGQILRQIEQCAWRALEGNS